MSEPQAIIVLEKGRFTEAVTREGDVRINLDSGKSKLSERNARYAVPYWRDCDEGNRIYHIETSETAGSTTSYSKRNTKSGQNITQ